MVYIWIYIRSLIVLIMPDFDKTFENEVNSFKDKEIYQLKKDMAIKQEEIQALYMEVKQQRSLAEKYQVENKHLKQQIKHLEEEAEEMINYP
jgi:peptidoglycan hydrolase CwlO-like protein